jgi:maleylacetoacetate isomerase
MAGEAAVPVLHSYWRSSCSYRVRIALAWKGVPFTVAPVHLLRDGGQQLAPEYARLNPMREVPTLEIDGAVLTQSSAIIEYLEETRPGRPLLPADPRARARVREICAIIGADIQPVQNLRVLKTVASFFSDPAEKEARKAAWAAGVIGGGFAGLEAVLAASAGAHAVGDDVTMADVFIVPQVYNAERFKVDMAPFPTLARVAAAAAALEPFRAAHPSAQPDAEA